LLFAGEYYRIPYRGEDATGLGKPLKSMLHGRADLPIYLAAIGPKNIELAAEIADGWLPFLFSPDQYDHCFRDAIEAGFARTPGKSMETFDVAPSVTVALGDDVDACRASVKPLLALYVGGMGAKGKNFYFDLVSRYGFAEEAAIIQEHFLEGRRADAAAAVPDALVDQVALCGPRERIAEGLERWRQSPVNTLIVNTEDPDVVELLAELVLGADAGRPERAYSLPPTAEPAAPTQAAPSAAQVLERLAARCQADATLAERVGALFQFSLAGDDGSVGDWAVDLRQPPGAISRGIAGGPDVTISMSEADFVAMAQGQINPMVAFSKGRIKIEGNPIVAMRLQALFG
jgi:hypothetical protein